MLFVQVFGWSSYDRFRSAGDSRWCGRACCEYQGFNGGFDSWLQLHTATANASVDTDTTSVGATYGMGDITLAIENNTTETAAGGTSADITSLGLHYSLGGGVTLFAEQKDDAKDSTAETTYWGIVQVLTA